MPALRSVSSWEGGFTSFPNALFHHYARLGLSEGELVFIQQLWTFWWGDRLPFPSLGTIAERMGKKVRQIQQYVHSLSTRGFLGVVSRTDAHGRQLTNAYDPRPLLRALADLEVGHRPDAPAPCDSASSGVWNPAPKENEHESRQDLDLGSVPLPPAGERINRGEERTAPVSDALLVRLALAPHSVAFGDEAPRASGSRAYALAKRYSVPLPQFETLLNKTATTTHARLPWVERRTPDAQVNAMPYFFGILERMIGRPEEALPVEVGARRRLGRSRGEVPAFPPPPPIPADTDPVWSALLTELRGMVAPAVFTDRLLRTKVRTRAEDQLEVEAEDVPKAHWLTHMLRRTLSAAQTNLGLDDLTVSFVASGTSRDG